MKLWQDGIIQKQNSIKTMTIKLILTGGTIDKHYNELNGELGFQETHIEQMLAQSRTQTALNIQRLMLKDSLEMTDQDRQAILEACLNSQEKQIIITHGTDTMVETSQVLASKYIDKTIVLLGAMIPYELKNSDALFNLGGAFIGVQTLKYGVYIVMNGMVFEWDKVRKDREAGVFTLSLQNASH